MLTYVLNNRESNIWHVYITVQTKSEHMALCTWYGHIWVSYCFDSICYLLANVSILCVNFSTLHIFHHLCCHYWPLMMFILCVKLINIEFNETFSQIHLFYNYYTFIQSDIPEVFLLHLNYMSIFLIYVRSSLYKKQWKVIKITPG